MAALSDADVALLRRIAHPDAAGVAGVFDHATPVGGLLAAGLVRFGASPNGDTLTYEHAWLAPTTAGLAWLEANPASAASNNESGPVPA